MSFETDREAIGTYIIGVWVFLVFIGNMRLFFGSHKSPESKLARLSALIRMKDFITSPGLILFSTMIHGFLANLTFTLGWIPAFKLLIFN